MFCTPVRRSTDGPPGYLRPAGALGAAASCRLQRSSAVRPRPPSPHRGRSRDAKWISRRASPSRTLSPRPGSYLHSVGFVHLRAVLDAAEIEALTSDVADALGRARPDDRKSWWTTVDGREVCNRVNYLNDGSPRIGALGADPRFVAIAALGGTDLRDAHDRLDGNSVVIKVPGSDGGLADLPWHRDCGMGGHPVKCPLLNVGIQLDAATADTGQLQMIPGSHRGTSRLPTAREAEKHPVVALTTEPGDVTVHFGHTLHAAPPPKDPARSGEAGAVPHVRAAVDVRDGWPRAGVQRRALHQERGAGAARRPVRLSRHRRECGAGRPGFRRSRHGFRTITVHGLRGRVSLGLLTPSSASDPGGFPATSPPSSGTPRACGSLSEVDSGAMPHTRGISAPSARLLSKKSSDCAESAISCDLLRGGRPDSPSPFLRSGPPVRFYQLSNACEWISMIARRLPKRSNTASMSPEG